MARSITSGFLDEINADLLRPALFAKAEFDDSNLNLWSGYGQIQFGSDTYEGSGQLLSISKIREEQELIANNLTFELSGVPSSIVSLALQEDYQNRPITAWLGVLDEDYQLIADPLEIFSGVMDTMELIDDGKESVIRVLGESELVDFRNRNERRYTPEDQKALFSGDLGFDFVPTIIDRQVTWGQNL